MNKNIFIKEKISTFSRKRAPKIGTPFADKRPEVSTIDDDKPEHFSPEYRQTNYYYSRTGRFSIDRAFFIKLLKSKKLSFSDLAVVLNLKSSQISQLFHGRRKAQVEEVLALCEFFGVSWEEMCIKLGFPVFGRSQPHSVAMKEPLQKIDDDAMGMNVTGVMEPNNLCNFFKTTEWVVNPTKIDDVFAVKFSDRHAFPNSIGFFLESYRVRDLRRESRLCILRTIYKTNLFGVVRRKYAGMGHPDLIEFEKLNEISTQKTDKKADYRGYKPKEIESLHPMVWLYVPNATENAPDGGYDAEKKPLTLDDYGDSE